jgi:hypothetical protein
LNNGKLNFYDRKKSHVGVDNFINIWDEGTNDYTTIESLIEEIQFDPVMDLLESCALSDRGNIQISVGILSRIKKVEMRRLMSTNHKKTTTRTLLSLTCCF